MELIDYITDLLVDFDEMGFAPTTMCPNPEAYAIEWRNKITKAFEELTEENERLTINMNAYGLTAKNLGEENERLRGILLQFTDIVHKWGNKNGCDTSEISLVPILNEGIEYKNQVKADTVRKMQERLKEEFADDSIHGQSEIYCVVDHIANEVLGEKK